MLTKIIVWQVLSTGKNAGKKETENRIYAENMDVYLKSDGNFSLLLVYKYSSFQYTLFTVLL